MRAFVAVDLDADLVDKISDVKNRLALGRLVPDENLHLTLAFLGNQSAAELERLHEVLCDVSLPAFFVSFRVMETLGGSTPKVLCLRASPNDSLQGLYVAVRNACRIAGITLERRRFRPHVTIARFGGGLSRNHEVRLGCFLSDQLPNVEFRGAIRSFSLFESILTPERAMHHNLAVYPLTGLAPSAA